MFSPLLLIKISFATLSSVGVIVGGYFLYQKTASNKTIEDKSKSPLLPPQNEEISSQG